MTASARLLSAPYSPEAPREYLIFHLPLGGGVCGGHIIVSHQNSRPYCRRADVQTKRDFPAVTGHQSRLHGRLHTPHSPGHSADAPLGLRPPWVLVLGPPACAARVVGPLVANAGRSERRVACARPTHSRRTRPWQACVPAAKRAAAQAAWPVDRLSTWHEPNGPAFTGLNGRARASYPGKNQGTRACPGGLSAAQSVFKSLTALTEFCFAACQIPFGRRPYPSTIGFRPCKAGSPALDRRVPARFRKSQEKGEKTYG